MMESRLPAGSPFYICQVGLSPADLSQSLSLSCAELLPVPDCQQPGEAALLLLGHPAGTGGQRGGQHGGGQGQPGPQHQPPHR